MLQSCCTFLYAGDSKGTQQPVGSTFLQLTCARTGWAVCDTLVRHVPVMHIWNWVIKVFNSL